VIKNKIIVSGLSLLEDFVSDTDGQCFACDYDLEWMFNHPSTLIWADKIIISPTIFKYIKEEKSPYHNSQLCGKVAKMFFEVADELGLLEVKKPSGLFSTAFVYIMNRGVENEFQELVSSYPEMITDKGERNSPSIFSIKNEHFCEPRVLAFYTSLALSKFWGAKILLNNKWKLYLDYSYNLKSKIKDGKSPKLKAFETIFSQYIPEMNLYPPDIRSNCITCKHFEKCNSEHLFNVEKYLGEYSKIREYDELFQLRKVINKIILRTTGEFNPNDIKREFSEVKIKLRKQMRKVFPSFSRWSKISTIISIPVITFGLSSGNHLISAAGGALAGMSKMIEKYIDLFNNKNRWIYFKQD